MEFFIHESFGRAQQRKKMNQTTKPKTQIARIVIHIKRKPDKNPVKRSKKENKQPLKF